MIPQQVINIFACVGLVTIVCFLGALFFYLTIEDEICLANDNCKPNGSSVRCDTARKGEINE